MAVHDLYRAFSDGIAGALQRGDVPWAPVPGGRPVRYNGRPYGGVSVLAQWQASRAHGYDSPVWLSRGTIDALGGRVPASALAATLWCAGMRPVASPSRATGDLVIRPGAVWRPYAAWNAEAVDGLSSKFTRAGVAAGEAAAMDRLVALAAAAGGHRSPRASSGQEFRMAGKPGSKTRDELEAGGWHAAGLAVEYRNHGPGDEVPGPWLVHGTGERAHDAQSERLGVCRRLVRNTAHPARLNRRVGEAQESLTVEIGAAFLAADLRLDAPGRPADADVEAWCRLLRRDDLAIFRSAGDAALAVGHIHATAPGHRVAVAMPLIRPLLGERTGAVARREVTGGGLRADESARMRAVDAARRFVTAAETWRRGASGGAEADRQGRSLLEEADRIDPAVPGVAEAIRAAAFLHGAGANAGADIYLAAFRTEAQARLQATDASEAVEPQAFRAAGPRM